MLGQVGQHFGRRHTEVEEDANIKIYTQRIHTSYENARQKNILHYRSLNLEIKNTAYMACLQRTTLGKPSSTSFILILGIIRHAHPQSYTLYTTIPFIQLYFRKQLCSETTKTMISKPINNII